MDNMTTDLNMDDAIAKNGRPIKSKKKKFYMIPIVLLVITLLIMAFIKLDIAKVGSNYVAPLVEDIPFVKMILPKKAEKGLYDNHSKEQLVDIISGSQIELEAAQLKIQEQIEQIAGLETKISELSVFEDEYLNFKEEKRLFDERIGNMDKDQYTQFYQAMYPENAQEIYAQIVQVQQMTKEQRKYAALISEMDETRAAKVLENLFQTDMDIILAILSNMETESASGILQEMDPQMAAMVVKQLSPQ